MEYLRIEDLLDRVLNVREPQPEPIHYDRRVYMINKKVYSWREFNARCKKLCKKHGIKWAKAYKSNGFYPLRKDKRWADPSRRQITIHMKGGWSVSAKRVSRHES